MVTLGDILNRASYLNHELVICGKHTGERIMWTPDMRVAPIGRAYFRSFLNAEARVDNDECAIYSSFDYCPQMVRDFLDSHQGEDIERATAKELFYRVGELAPCDCAHCDDMECGSRDRTMRFPRGIGGISACKLLEWRPSMYTISI